MELRQRIRRLLTSVILMFVISHVNSLVGPGDCDFEDDLCNWQNDDVDNFDWLRGPTCDHQAKDKECSRNYIYNDKHSSFEKGRLISPVMNEAKCMMFSYFINATNMTSLQVYIRVNGTETLTWVRSGWRIGYWAEGQVLFNEARPYQVIVMATSHGILRGQTSVDNIRFMDGHCSQENGTFYVSRNKFFKVGSSPPTDDWDMHFSFTARTTTRNLSESKYFVYPATGQNPIISLDYSQSPFPVEFFYSMDAEQASETIVVITNKKSRTQELKTTIHEDTAFTFPAVLFKEKSPGCLSRWIRLEDSCFRFQIENTQTWNGARKTCRIFNGDLIDSKGLNRLKKLPLEMLFESVENKDLDWILWYKKVQSSNGQDVRCGAFHLIKNTTEYKSCSETRHGFICQSMPVDVAMRRPATSSVNSSMASLAVDGLPYTCFYFQTSQTIMSLNVTLPRTMFVHEVQFNPELVYIEILVLEKRDIRLCYDFRRNVDSRGRIISVQRSRFKCKYLTKGDVVSIKNLQIDPGKFCQISIIGYSSIDDVKGVVRELSYDDDNITVEMQRSVVTSPFEIDEDYGESFKTFMKVPMSGNYTFHLFCSYNNPCSLDIKRWDDHVSIFMHPSFYEWQTLISAEKSPAYNEDDNMCIQKTSKSLYLSKCTVYVLTVGNPKARGDHRCFSLGMTRPDGIEENPINREYLFSKDPGLRILEFNVMGYNEEQSNLRKLLNVRGQLRVRGPDLGLAQPVPPKGMMVIEGLYVYPNRNTAFRRRTNILYLDPSWWINFSASFPEVHVGIGQIIHFEVKYRNWCFVSMSCPNCSMRLELRFLDSIVRIDNSVPYESKENVFKQDYTVLKAPGSYDLEFVYSFLEDPSRLPTSRKVATVYVKTAIIQNDEFKLNSGKWTTSSSTIWNKEAIEFLDNRTAALESPVLKWKAFYSKIKFCLAFGYLLSSNTTSSLQVFLKTQGDSSRLLWQVRGFRPRSKGRLPFYFRNNSKLLFVGNRTANSTGPVSLFDVSITSKTCDFVPLHSSPEFRCGNDEFQCYSGPCISNSKRCDGDKDCSDGTDEINCNCFTTQLACFSGGCVDSKDLCDGIKQCSDGADEKRCVGKCTNRFACPDGKCISWNSTCSTSREQLDQCQDKSHSPTVCGGLTDCPLNDLNCKDKEVADKVSYSFREPCSFSYGFCGLTQDNSTGLTWKIGKGVTPTEETGPSYDHTSYSKTGRYIYLETSSGTDNENACLSSDWLQLVSPSSCLQFWYHMNGSDIGALQIIMKTRHAETVIWSRHGQQGNRWYLGQVEVTIPEKPDTLFQASSNNETVKIIFEGIKSFGPKGDIAVDDISVLDGKCAEPRCDHLTSSYIMSAPNACSFTCTSTNVIKLLFSTENPPYTCLQFWYILEKVELHISFRILGLLLANGKAYIQSFKFDQITTGWSYVQVPLDEPTNSLEITIRLTMKTGGSVGVRGLSLTNIPCESIGLQTSPDEDSLILNKTKHVGCTRVPINSATGHIPSLESIDPLLTGSYKKRKDAIGKCAQAAYRRGFEVFAVENGGKCLANLTAVHVYPRYGVSDDCGQSGKGGKSASDVYRIERTCPEDSMCKWKKNGTQFIEKEIIQGFANNTKTKSKSFPGVLQLQRGQLIYTEGNFELQNQFTICLWVKCRYLHGFSITLLDKAKQILIRVGGENCELFLALLGQTLSGEHCTCNGMWNHLCFTWKSFYGVWEIYVNGLLNYFGRAWNRGENLPVSQRITLENHKSRPTASSHPISFTGINIWRKIFSPEEILHMSYGCQREGVAGDVISWETFKNTLPGSYSQLTNSVECIFAKGVQLMNSSSSMNGIAEMTRWFNRSATGKGKCMRFLYMMLGKGSMSLMVLQKIPVIGEKVIWRDDDSPKTVWKKGELSLGTTTKYKVTVRGQFEVHSIGFIAIGGLYITEGYCESVQVYSERACSKVLTSLSGVMTSPLYPAAYPPGSSCTWQIRVPEGMVVRLFAVVFSLHFKPRCDEDYIAVYDGPSRDHSPMIGRYCDSNFTMLESTSNTLTLVFNSTPPFKYRTGFEIKYLARAEPPGAKHSVHCPASCRCFYIPGDKRRLVVEGKSLSIVPGNIPDDTAVLLLSRNNIHRLKTKELESKRVLEYIDLNANRLLYIDNRAFSILQSIQTIKLNMNFLRSLGREPFHNLSSLQVLDLAENLIDDVHPDTFSTLVNLQVLSLRSNYIFDINPEHFRGNSELQYLYLQHNQITKIQDFVFKSLLKLKVLSLNDNKIKEISQDAFRGLHSLDKLHLQNNKFAVVPVKTFSDMENLKFLEVDNFMLCCFAKQFAPNAYCDAPADEFSSCDDLMKNKAARASIWILGILAFLGNICVIAWRLTLSEENRVQSLLLTNLAISDFLMGVYLLIIAIKDAQWKNVYFIEDFQWRNGRLCQFTGALSMLSSEVSVLMLTIITADRLKSIVYPLKFGKLSYKSALVISLLVWVFGLVIAFLPTSGLHYFYNVEAEMGFYGRSSVCLPLQLSTSRLAGWEYSVSIFIALNFVSFVFIFFAYLVIFIKVKRSSAKTKSMNAKKEAAMAWKVMAIILTDFCCWMPVIIIGVLSLIGQFHDPQGLAYVWIAVFVLPVNSSINPILYTFSNADVRKKFTSLFGVLNNGYGKTASTRVTPTSFGEMGRKDRQLPSIPRFNLKLNEVSLVLQSEMPVDGEGYLTCWATENGSESFLLLKCFISEHHVNWIREVNVLKLLNSGAQHENLMSYKWHAKVKNLEIETNSVEIPGLPLSPDCSYIPLKKFLHSSEFTASVGNLLAVILDVLKAVEELHVHGVSHGDIAPHNILIENDACGRFPVRAVIGGFGQARIVKSTTRAAQAYKTDIQQLGNLVEEMFITCGHRGQLNEVKNVIEMCFQECQGWRERITEIRSFFETAVGDNDSEERETRV